METTSSTTTTTHTLSPAFLEMLSKQVKDMRLVGLFYIIYGGLTCLSIIGAIVGIPMLISGLRAREAAKHLETYEAAGNFDALASGLEQQGQFFRFQKIYVLINLAFLALMFVFFAIALGFGIMSGFSESTY